MKKLPYINLGCGATFHNEWENIDFVSTSPLVKSHNLIKGIPYPDNSFKVVYHSHVLEHFPKAKAVDFIKECYRILQPGGIIRIAVPDLEQIATNYVKYLNDSIQGVKGAEQKYDWTMLELFDQIVRSKSGGEMIEYIKDTSKNNDEFLLERNGHEVKRIMESFREIGATKVSSGSPSYSMYSRLKSVPGRIKNKLLHFLLADEYNAYQAGVFRSKGEIHQWMYDRFSLGRLLHQVGFVECKVATATESRIENWDSFGLDTKNGVVRKPDSLFMEAIK